MKKLYCVQLGESMRDTFLAEAGKYEYGKALFLVPGRFLGKIVKKAGTVRTVIMDYLPNEILRANALDGEFTRISRPAQEMLISSIIADLAAKGELPYFGSLVEKQGFSKNMISFMGELSRAGVTVEEFATALEAWERPANLREKDKEILKIYACYRQKLENGNLYDVEGLYRLAVKALEQDNCVVPWQKLYFSEFYQFDTLQLNLIKALGQHVDLAIGLFYDPQRPALSAGTLHAYEDLVGIGFNVEQIPANAKRAAGLAQLVSNWRGKRQLSKCLHNIRVKEAYNAEDEMRSTLAEMKALHQQGVAYSDMVCLVRSLENYDGFSRLFAEYKLPTVLPQVTGFAGQAVADFFTKLLTLAFNSNEVENWQNFLACSLGHLVFGVEKEKLEEAYNTRFFASGAALQRYCQQEKLILKQQELLSLLQALQGKKTPAEFIQVLLTALESWQLPQVAGRHYKAGELSLTGLQCLVESAAKSKEILELMQEDFVQSGQSSVKVTVKTVLELWQQRSRQELLTLQRGAALGIPVLEAANVQGVTFPYVFLLGLREGEFPQLKNENWLYNDQERADLKVLGISRTVTANSMASDQYFFASALAMATRQLTLSYYEDESAGASSYIQELSQYYTKEAWQVEKTLNGKTDGSTKEELVKLLVTHTALGSKEKAFLCQELGNDFSRRQALDRERWQPVSQYNGQMAGGYQPEQLSASAVDAYIACPFSFLAARLWETKPWQVLTDEVQPASLGELYHATLAKFLSKHLQENLSRLDSSALEEELSADLQAVYEQMLTKQTLLASEYREYELVRYKQVLTKWLWAEIDYQSRQGKNLLPKELELAFGRSQNSLPPLTLSIEDGPVNFSGQIDRVDTDGEYYILLDYKSGGVPTGTELKNGQALQLPIYALALEQLCHIQPEKILGAGYYELKSGKRKGGMWQEELSKQLPWLEHTRLKGRSFNEIMTIAKTALNSCVHNIRQGVFPAQPVVKCPSYCPYTDICRFKLKNSSTHEEDSREEL